MNQLLFVLVIFCSQLNPTLGKTQYRFKPNPTIKIRTSREPTLQSKPNGATLQSNGPALQFKPKGPTLQFKPKDPTLQTKSSRSTLQPKSSEPIVKTKSKVVIPPNWVNTIDLLGGATCSSAAGFPASPKTIIPFISNWQNPPVSLPKPVSTAFPYSAEFQGRKIEYHEIHAVNLDVPIFNPGNPTKFFAYKLPDAQAGTVPGPTIIACKGVQTLVRFKNFLEGPTNEFSAGQPFPPHVGNRAPGPDVCSTNFVNPWPIQVHLHGSGSLAPYDGWADDVIFSGCGKDYLYPNNRAAILWYHDHAIHHTAFNAYNGLASQYWVDDCCSEISNSLPKGAYDLPFILRDAVFDVNDQLLFDTVGAHRDDLYGDHILVNGVPWPVLHVEPRQYRFRMLAASISRPFLLAFSDQPTSYFLVIGTDGGFLPSAVQTDKLRIGLGERYDVIIDFSQPAFAGLTEVILHNQLLYDVPMFCQTHLVAKFIIDLPLTPPTPLPSPTFTPNVFVHIPPAGVTLPPSTPSPIPRVVDPVRPVIVGQRLLYGPLFQTAPGTIPIGPLSRPLSPPLVPDAFITLASDLKVPARRRLRFVKPNNQWKIEVFDNVNGATTVVGGGPLTWDSTYNTLNGVPLATANQWTTRTGLPEHVSAVPLYNHLEVWELENGGGGWFHPIHLHLIDFLLVHRSSGVTRFTQAKALDGLADYERSSAKDVVFLGPGEKLRVVARFGPHGGNYMMHCHNLIHEDNDMMVGFRVTPDRLIFNPTDPSFGDLDLPGGPPSPFDDPLSQRAQPIASLSPISIGFLASFLQLDIHRVLYPPEQNTQGYPVDWKAAPYFSQSTLIPPFLNPFEVPYVALDHPEMCPYFKLTHAPAPGGLSFYGQVTPAVPGIVGAVTGPVTGATTAVAGIAVV